MRDLPDGWTVARIGDLVDVIRGVSFPSEAKGADSDGRVPCLRTKNVQDTLDWDDLIFVPGEYVKSEVQYLCPRDVLISTANSYELVGKVAYADQVPRRATIGAFISILRPFRDVDPRFVFFALASPDIRRKVRDTAATTTNISNISLTRCAEIEVLLPPIAEQRRIVAEVEKQFTRLDEATRLLDRIRTRATRLRSSAIKTCLAPFADRPIRSFVDVVTGIRNGISTKPVGDRGPEILKISAVRPFDLRLDERRFLPPTGDYSGFELREEDLLFTRYNGNREFVGTCARVPKLDHAVFYPDKLIRVRLKAGHEPRFYELLFNGGSARKHIQARIRTTAGQSGISGADIKTAPIPIASPDEQYQAVQVFDRIFAATEHLDHDAYAAEARVVAIKRAILAKAFSGQLVPQDPNDEPASVLLERIRSQRASESKKKTARRRKFAPDQPELALQS